MYNSIEIYMFKATTYVSITQNTTLSELFKNLEKNRRNRGLWLWFLTPLSTIFQSVFVVKETWQSVLLVEETEVPGENRRPATSH